MLTLRITHSASNIQTEKRVDGAAVTVGALKERLHAVVGTSPEHMVLQLKDRAGAVVKSLQPDDAPLAALGVPDDAHVHVLDTDPLQSAARLHDVSQVEKYTISEEAYSKRKDTFREFKKHHLQHVVADEEAKRLQRAEAEAKEAELAKGVAVGARCEVATGQRRRGTVMFVGPLRHAEDAECVRVGVKLDEPLGKHDGTVRGVRYFACPPKYGELLKPSELRVGDFPEIDPFADDEEEDVMAEL